MATALTDWKTAGSGRGVRALLQALRSSAAAALPDAIIADHRARADSGGGGASGVVKDFALRRVSVTNGAVAASI
jgi:hypothetical protein